MSDEAIIRFMHITPVFYLTLVRFSEHPNGTMMKFFLCKKKHSIGRIIKIAQALDTTPEYLTGWTDANIGSSLVDGLDYNMTQLINYFSELDEVG